MIPRLGRDGAIGPIDAGAIAGAIEAAVVPRLEAGADGVVGGAAEEEKGEGC